MFLNDTFTLDTNSLFQTPTYPNHIGNIKIYGGDYDEFVITKDTTLSTDETFSRVWTIDTILHALFENNLNAGNLNYSANQIEYLLIKRRLVSSNKWIPLWKIPIKNSTDFNFSLFDRYCRNNKEYVYSLTPILSGTYSTEGGIFSNNVISEFKGVFICSLENNFGTILNTSLKIDNDSDSATFKPLGRKYPVVISNGLNNGDTGTVEATFIEYDYSSNIWKIAEAYDYRTNVNQFINNRKPKILKYHDGRMWLVNMTGKISESPNGHEDNIVTTINFTEIGDCDDAQDLYNNGLIDFDPNFTLENSNNSEIDNLFSGMIEPHANGMSLIGKHVYVGEKNMISPDDDIIYIYDTEDYDAGIIQSDGSFNMRIMNLFDDEYEIFTDTITYNGVGYYAIYDTKLKIKNGSIVNYPTSYTWKTYS